MTHEVSIAEIANRVGELATQPNGEAWVRLEQRGVVTDNLNTLYLYAARLDSGSLTELGGELTALVERYRDSQQAA